MEKRPPPPAPSLQELVRIPELGGYRGGVPLDLNERVAPLPEWFLENVRRKVSSDLLATYPLQEPLLRELAAHVGVPRAMVLLTPGSDAGIKSLFQAYLRPDDRVVALDPSYGMFPIYAQMFGARIVRVPFEKGPKLDPARLLAAIEPGVRLAIIANPNQPTGTLLEDALLDALVEKTAAVGALLCLDEAYYPFTRTTGIPRIAANPHVLVLRTLSKAAGLAGLRIGFAVAHPEVIANLFKVRAVCDVSSFAIECAREVLAHDAELVDTYVAEVHAGEKVLADRARALGLEPLPTHANFMLLRVAGRCPPARLVERLKARGFLVKGPFAASCIEDCIRVTLGPPAVMSAFGDALEAALAG
jgi:histidinol-phosphate aminotransferase